MNYEMEGPELAAEVTRTYHVTLFRGLTLPLQVVNCIRYPPRIQLHLKNISIWQPYLYPLLFMVRVTGVFTTLCYTF